MKLAVALLVLAQASISLGIYRGEVVGAADPVYFSTVMLSVPENGTWAVKCSGTIVAPRLVVSAAHCIAQHEYRRIVVTAAGNQYEVTHLAYPLGYYDSEIGSRYRGLDVSVLQVARDFAPPSRPVALSPSAREPIKGTMTQAGFGFGDLKETADLGKLRKLRNAEISHESLDPDTPKQQFTLTNGSDATTLRGDSGGPLYILEDGALHLRGVLSGGGALTRRASAGTMTKERLSIYTDVAYFHDWLGCSTGVSFERSDGLPPQIRCRRGDRLFPMAELAKRNSQRCGQWPGWKLVRSTCWPGTKDACDAYAAQTHQTLTWHDDDKTCR